MTDLFKEILPSILETKKDVLENDKDYVPFVINRALSYHSDCLYYANQMNMLNKLDRRLQYDFLLNIVRPRRRSFERWAKPLKEDNLQAVKMYFGYSNKKALEALKTLTDEQIELIKKRTISE